MSGRRKAGLATEAVGSTLPAASALPASHTPAEAGHASGPFIRPVEVIPTEWEWKHLRTYLVIDAAGRKWRTLRVSNRSGEFVGYWAIELVR